MCWLKAQARYLHGESAGALCQLQLLPGQGWWPAPVQAADCPCPASLQVVDAKDPNSYKTEDGAPSASGLDQAQVFLGLISLVDPPRPGVLEAVHKARAAGV